MSGPARADPNVFTSVVFFLLTGVTLLSQLQLLEALQHIPVFSFEEHSEAS